MVFRASCKFDRSHCGLVLGKGGKGLQQLKQIRGVFDVLLYRTPITFTLYVIAVRKEHCDAVFQEARRRINSYLINKKTFSFLIDVEDKSLNIIVLAPCLVTKSNTFVVGRGRKDHEEYVVGNIIRGSRPCDNSEFRINENASEKSSFMELNEKSIMTSFQSALDLHDMKSSDHRITFHVSLGKMTFTMLKGSTERFLDRNLLTEGSQYLMDRSIGTHFNPDIGPHYLASIEKKLIGLDFKHVEEEQTALVTVNFDECTPTWTNCSITLYGDQAKDEVPENGTKSSNDNQKVVKVFNHRKRLRNFATLSTNRLDVCACLASVERKEACLTEAECRAFKLCWDDWTLVDELLSDMEGDDQLKHGFSLTCLKQVQESYIFVKDVPFPHDGEETSQLAVGIKRVKKKSQKFGLRENCIELVLYFKHDRDNVTGEVLTAEFMELKKWAECLVC